jgi:hypothetical protein
MGRLSCGAALQGKRGGLAVERPMAPIRTAVLKIDPELLKPRWRLHFLGGASLAAQNGLEAGVLWSSRRWGVYGVAERTWASQESVGLWRVHAGVALLVH